MKVEWTMALYKMPDDNIKNIWLSDGITTWAETLPCTNYGIKNYYWAERINPMPPEKEKHCCKNPDPGSLIGCREDSRGTIYIELCSLAGDRIIYNVIYCPFCGYKPEAN